MPDPMEMQLMEMELQVPDPMMEVMEMGLQVPDPMEMEVMETVMVGKDTAMAAKGRAKAREKKVVVKAAMEKAKGKAKARRPAVTAAATTCMVASSLPTTASSMRALAISKHTCWE